MISDSFLKRSSSFPFFFFNLFWCYVLVVRFQDAIITLMQPKPEVVVVVCDQRSEIWAVLNLPLSSKRRLCCPSVEIIKILIIVIILIPLVFFLYIFGKSLKFKVLFTIEL